MLVGSPIMNAAQEWAMLPAGVRVSLLRRVKKLSNEKYPAG